MSEQSVSSKDWFTQFPLDYYAKIGSESGNSAPEQVPSSQPFGTPQVDVRVGPIIRLLGTLENNSPNYRGTILLVTFDENSTYDANGQPPAIDFTIGPSAPRYLQDQQASQVTVLNGSFPGQLIYQEAGYSFWRYNVDLSLLDFEQKVVYSVNGTIKPEFNFYVPALAQSMNVVSFSCNGFSLATVTSAYKNSLWYDVLANHEVNHYHVAIGGGDQLYCDKVKLVSKFFQEWLEEVNPLKKVKAEFTDDLAQSLREFYLNAYIEWFGKGWWSGANGQTWQALFPVAMSTIPTVNIYDDHDIIDGYGTYKHQTMNTSIFKGLGEVAYKYYMLFQHHTAPESVDPTYSTDPSWILGHKPGPYIQQLAHSQYIRLGREIAYVGLDCRTERRRDQVLTPDSYAIIFKRLRKEIELANGEIKHLLVLLGVPIAYPRLVWLEKLLTSKFFIPIRGLAQKGIIAKGLVNEFDGSVEVLDDLEDHWCAKHHKAERNKLIALLQDFGARHGVRVTILSGDVHLAAVGRFKSRIHKHTVQSKKIQANEEILAAPERDPRLILNIISSAITNAPPPNGMATLLQKRSKVHRFDRNTDEDMVRLFKQDVDGVARGNDEFNNKRNWADLILVKQVPKYDGVAKGIGKLPGLIDDEGIADASADSSTGADAANGTTAPGTAADTINDAANGVTHANGTAVNGTANGSAANGSAANGTAANSNDPAANAAAINGAVSQTEAKLYTTLEKNTINRVAYPVLPDGLLTVIHIEREPTVVNSKGARYEVVIPPLVEKQALENIGVKD